MIESRRSGRSRLDTRAFLDLRTEGRLEDYPVEVIQQW